MYVELPKRLTVRTKYRIARSVFWLFFFGVVLSIYMISVYGTSEAAGFKLKVWFVVMIFSFLVGMISGVIYYYFKAKLDDPDTGLIELETLSKAINQNQDEPNDK